MASRDDPVENFSEAQGFIHSFIHKQTCDWNFPLQMRVLRVALDVPVAKLFDYLIDDATAAAPGDRVVVPFGARDRVGVVVEIGDGSAVASAKRNHDAIARRSVC